MDEIIPSFELSLFDPVFSSTLELIEIGIDSGISNELVKGIPILGTIVGIGKTIYNVNERNTIKQLVTFIKEFNSKKISQEKLDKYREELKSDPKKAEKELGRVLIIVDRTVDGVKTKMLAQLYNSYVDEFINWEEFCDFSEIVNRIFLADINLLYKINSGEVTETGKCPVYQVERLASIGLITTAMKSMVIGTRKGSETEKYISISTIGEKFCKIVTVK